MADRWPIAVAIKIARGYVISQHTSEAELENDEQWADICRKYPHAAGQLLLLAQNPASIILEYIAPVQSVRKIETAMKKRERYSEMDLGSLLDDDDDMTVDEHGNVAIRRPGRKSAHRDAGEEDATIASMLSGIDEEIVL